MKGAMGALCCEGKGEKEIDFCVPCVYLIFFLCVCVECGVRRSKRPKEMMPSLIY